MQTILRECSGTAGRLADIVGKPGKIFAPLPAHSGLARAQKFEAGGFNDHERAVDWLFRDVTSKRNGALIFQDIWLLPSDIEARRPAIENYLSDGEQVYYYSLSSTLDPGSLEVLYKQIRSFRAIGFYIEDSLNLSFEQRRKHRVPVNFFNRFEQNVTSIYVGAYDQESWVVWRASDNYHIT